MVKIIRDFCLLFCIICISSCADDLSDDLTGKWQLVRSETSGGSVEYIQNVFYNFQEGSFSCTHLLKDGTYVSFFGCYFLKDAEISIILLPESVENIYFETCMGWENGMQNFLIADISVKELLLMHAENRYIFRRY